jgi:hypothetical protein
MGKIMKTAAIGVILASLAAPVSIAEDQDNTAKKPPGQTQQLPQSNGKNKIEYSGFFSSGVATDYQPYLGLIIGSGPVIQNSFRVNMKKRNSTLSFFGWNNVDLKNIDPNEYDFGFGLEQDLSKKAKLFVGYERWSYPTGIFGKPDNVIDSYLMWNPENSSYEIKFDVKTLLTGKTSGKSVFFIEGSKKINFWEKNRKKIDVKIGGQYAYAAGFFGFDGNMHYRLPVVDIEYKNGNNSIIFQVRPQNNLSSRITNKTNWSLIYKKSF